MIDFCLRALGIIIVDLMIGCAPEGRPDPPDTPG